MKKVYITSLHMLHGGVEMAITLLANALTVRGYNVEILCTYNLCAPAYPLDHRVKITYLTDCHPNREAFKAAVQERNLQKILSEGFYSVHVLYKKKKTMIKKIREIQDGIIISTRNEHSVLLSKYGHKHVKKIAQLHHDHGFKKRLVRDFKNHYKNIDYFLLLTDQLRDEVKEIMVNNKHTRVLTMPNFLTALPDLPEQIPVRQALALGRLHPVKGFDRLIPLWGKVSLPEPMILKIIGEGSEQEALEQLIRENNLEGRVVLTGAMDHDLVMEEMARSCFCVMTSYTEGFPFVLIEAMANGLPAIAYDVRVGPRAIMENEKNGFLVEDGHEDVFLARINELAENKILRQNFSRAARERACVFTEEQVMPAWLRILEE